MIRTFRGLIGFGFILVICIFIILLFIGNKNNLSLDTLSRIQKELVKYHLFLLQPAGKKEVFQGRWLNKYEFAVDADAPYPSLEVWLDDFNSFVGVSAFWDGNRWGSPANIKSIRKEDGIHYYFCNISICNGFKQLTGIDLEKVIGENKSINKGTVDTFNYEYKTWRIVVFHDKASGFVEATESFKAICNWNKEAYEPNSKDVDFSIYPFSVFGVSW
jgi:hypothetical protein